MSDFQALIESNRRLTETVESKVSEIDAAVAAAVKAIPELGRAFYIDAIAGRDSNSGTIEEPIQTVKEAFVRSINVPFVTIYLKGGQTHEYVGRDNSFIYWEVSGAVRFYKYGSGERPIFLPKPTTYGGFAALNFLAPVDGGSVYFEEVHVKVPNDKQDGYENVGSFGHGLISRGHGGRVLSGSVMLSRCVFEISNIYWGVIPSYASDLQLILYSTEVRDSIGDGTAKFADITTTALSFVVMSSSYSASLVSWNNMIKGVAKGSTGVPHNIISNINFE